MQVGAITALSATATIKATSATHFKAEAALGDNTAAIWAELGVKHSWSELTSTYFAVRYGFMGTICRMKVKRGPTIVQNQVLLTPRYQDWQTMVAAVVVPTIANVVITRCVAVDHCVLVCFCAIAPATMRPLQAC
jgi:hypothetical protein